MPRKSNGEILTQVHQDAMREFDDIQSAMRDERAQCLEDRRFYSIPGAQWEGGLGDQFENKPKYEVNKVHMSVIDIIKEYRNNRIDVKFVSKDGAKDDSMADTCAACYRADEQDSCAEEAYDNAFEESVGGGFGAWRLRADIEEDEDGEDEENEQQRIRIEPIVDADTSVFFDLNAKRQDKSDARTCFVITSMTRAEYEREYDDDPATWPKDLQSTEYDWLTDDVVYVAEYYLIENVKTTVHVFQGLTGTIESYSDEELEDDEDLARRLSARGFEEIKQKKRKKRKVHKYVLNGARVLEDCGYIAGRHIPIVPTYGKRWFVDNLERCQGHIRLAKDSQRLKNMQLSTLGMIVASSGIEKPIVSPGQIAGHQVMWADDNVMNWPYLVLNATTDAAGNEVPSGPAAYTKAPAVPQALAALLELTDRDMKEILGNSDQVEKQVSHVAGKTVEALQRRVDSRTAIYLSNMAKAIRRCGQIWLSMAREIYVESGRKMKGLDENGVARQIELKKPMIGPDSAVTMRNDFTKASFDVVVEVGPSSESKRSSTLSSILDMLGVTKDPETAEVLSRMAVMNMDGEGISDIREWMRKKLLRSGVLRPNEEEAKELAAEAQNTPQDPNALFLYASAEEAKAKAALAQANVALTGAKVGETQAKTLETLAGVDEARLKAAVETEKNQHDMAMDRADFALSLQPEENDKE